jgi:hypothetical protein
LASIFGTLLSSQESDAHQHNTFQRHTGATIQIYSDPPRQSNRLPIEDQGEFARRDFWAVDDFSTVWHHP